MDSCYIGYIKGVGRIYQHPGKRRPSGDVLESYLTANKKYAVDFIRPWPGDRLSAQILPTAYNYCYEVL